MSTLTPSPALATLERPDIEGRHGFAGVPRTSGGFGGHFGAPMYSIAMGIFHVDIDVIASSDSDAERHIVLVDTGASYLALPGSVLRRLGYRPLDTQRVIFATGQVAVWPVAEVKVRLADAYLAGAGRRYTEA